MRVVFAGLVLGVSLCLFTPAAFADDSAPVSLYTDLSQIPLTEQQLDNYMAAMADMRAAMGGAAADAPEPDAQAMAKLEGVAKAHGFRDFADYNTVAGNIQIVLDGIDSESKTYVGAEKMMQRSISEVKADNKMTPADKRAALVDLQAQLKSVPPVANKGNIDLVVKNYDKLSAD
jgi:hypothetical protein